MPPISLRVRGRRPISVHEARRTVDRVLEEREPELTYDQREAVKYLKKFGRLDEETLKRAKERLRTVARDLTANERTIEVLVHRILDVLPSSEEEVKTVLESAGKRLLRRADESVIEEILEVTEEIRDKLEEGSEE